MDVDWTSMGTADILLILAVICIMTLAATWLESREDDDND